MKREGELEVKLRAAIAGREVCRCAREYENPYAETQRKGMLNQGNENTALHLITLTTFCEWWAWTTHCQRS